MRWINRELQDVLASASPILTPFPVWLLTGPRQVGKSSLLKRLGADRTYINLDDPITRARATEDPISFGKSLSLPLTIDEIQYAPQLLSAIKVLADSADKAGAIWLTGSQSFEVMRGVRESLAGRVALLNLFGLSDEEKRRDSPDSFSLFHSMWLSSFPKLHPSVPQETWELYMSSYVQTYIQRDVQELLGIQKRREFEVFLKVCALRTGQRVNFDELGRDAGISGVTAKGWLSVLEDSFLIKLIHPYYSNRTKRLVKQPKLYFLDMGIAAYLAGWKTHEMLSLGAMRGAAYETHIFGQVLRHFKHRARECEFSYLYTKDGEEIDLLVESRGKVFPIEMKAGDVRAGSLVKLDKFREPSWQPARVVSPSAGSVETAIHGAPGWLLASPESLRFLDG